MVAGLWWLYSPGVLCLPTITQIKHNIFKPKLVLKIFFKLLFYIILFHINCDFSKVCCLTFKDWSQGFV